MHDPDMTEDQTVSSYRFWSKSLNLYFEYDISKILTYHNTMANQVGHHKTSSVLDAACEISSV